MAKCEERCYLYHELLCKRCMLDGPVHTTGPFWLLKVQSYIYDNGTIVLLSLSFKKGTFFRHKFRSVLKIKCKMFAIFFISCFVMNITVAREWMNIFIETTRSCSWLMSNDLCHLGRAIGTVYDGMCHFILSSCVYSWLGQMVRLIKLFSTPYHATYKH